MEESIEDFIEKNLVHGKVTIWTRGEDCSVSGNMSSKAKRLLAKNNIEFEERQVNDKDHSFASYCLMMHTGYGTYPNIFFGEEHIGGYDDLKAYMLDPLTT